MRQERMTEPTPQRPLQCSYRPANATGTWQDGLALEGLSASGVCGSQIPPTWATHLAEETGLEVHEQQRGGGI